MKRATNSACPSIAGSAASSSQTAASGRFEPVGLRYDRPLADIARTFQKARIDGSAKFMRLISAQILTISLMFAMPVAHSVMIETNSVQLSSNDHAAVTNAACPRNTPPTSEHVSALRYVEQPGEPIHASVICAIHRTGAGEVVRSRAECENATGRWKCTDLGDFLDIGVGGKKVHVQVSGPEGRHAANIARYLLTINSYDGFPLSERIDGSLCFVRASPLNAWEVSCGNTEVRVAQDCDHGKCAYRAFGNLSFFVE